jgi:hypothetical protein
VQSVPTHAELIAAIGGRFSFGVTGGHTVEAVLLDAPAGVPMDDSYVCYLATFELPEGAYLPQDVYRIVSPEGAAWDLLATPARPSANGCSRLAIVVHGRAVELAAGGNFRNAS